jgi:hypothetical protein
MGAVRQASPSVASVKNAAPVFDVRAKQRPVGASYLAAGCVVGVN